MALEPTDERHAGQIHAGTQGRNRGHRFERNLTSDINNLDYSRKTINKETSNHNLIIGYPPYVIVDFIAGKLGIRKINKVTAWWVGALATSGEGDELIDESGNRITKCKSDILLKINHQDGILTTGVSVKTCNKRINTNDQLYFTTAQAFCRLLRQNGIVVTNEAEMALKMFCGDEGFRPLDKPSSLVKRKSDPDRWFWEELPTGGREALELLFLKYQREITTLLLQKAYQDDPYPPEFLFHQTVAFNDINKCPIAIYQIHELVDLSCKYSSFCTRPYTVSKGRFKGDPKVHLAPRFGIVQFQRGGQKQHPTQLQFNLQAGYFKKLPY